MLNTNSGFNSYIIGISGGSASGKTSVAAAIYEKMGIKDCTLITMDSYYKYLEYILTSKLVIQHGKI